MDADECVTRWSDHPANRSAIRGVVFDSDDVLCHAMVWQRWLWQLLARLSVAGSFDDVMGRWEGEFLCGVIRGDEPFAVALRRFLSAIELSAPQVDEVFAASLARRRELEAQSRPLPAVRPTLARLKRDNVPCAVVALGDETSEQLHAQLSRCSLADFFGAIVGVSLSREDAAADQPRLCAAAAALALDPAELALVSSRSAALAVARSAGWTTIAMRPATAADGDATIELLNELPAVVLAAREQARLAQRA